MGIIQATKYKIEQHKINKFTFKEDCIKDYIKLLLECKFKIFVFEKKNIGWFMFSLNDKIGSCEYDFMRGFTFSSKHKPNRETGTGYQTETEILNPTMLNAINTFIDFPTWENKTKNKNSVIKYKDLKEYFQEETILNYFEII
ncbi:MAG: hypothetical protein IH845_05180 [Nanoarchaeota archaeon]|nr:hypothetical protein [Nanoarchaeota archaeon]